MIQKNQIRKWLGLFFLMALLGSCEQESFNEPPEAVSVSPSLLEEAKAWYNTQKKGHNVYLHPQTKADAGILLYSEPSWELCFKTENERYSAIDVALTDRIGLDFVTSENIEAYHQTGNYHFRRSYTRLVILTDKKNGEKTGFLMTFIPSIEYTENYLGRIGKTTYLQRDNQLDGLVLFHNLDGSFSNGWQYTHGQVSGYIPELLSAQDTLASQEKNIKYINLNLFSCSYSFVPTKASGDKDSVQTAIPIPIPTPGSGIISVDPLPFPDSIETTTPVQGPDLGEVTVTPSDPSDTPILGGGGVTAPVHDNNSNNDGTTGSYIHKDPPQTQNPVPVGPTKYVKKDGDKLVKKHLPQTMTTQLPNLCVPAIMEYIDNKIFNGTTNQGVYFLYYLNTYNKYIAIDGVDLLNIDEFVKHFFKTTQSISFPNAIDQGYVIMTNIKSNIKNSSHNVVIVGYKNNGEYIYMDPEKGCLYSAYEDYFLKTYTFIITGKK